MVKLQLWSLFRMTVAFFALSALDLLGALDLSPAEVKETAEWIYSLQVTSEGHGVCRYCASIFDLDVQDQRTRLSINFHSK